MANPEKIYWEAVKWVLHYLRGTSDYTITYSKSSSSIQGYVDANFIGDLDKRKLTMDYVFQNENDPISWMSKLQVTVALPNIEAEYMH